MAQLIPPVVVIVVLALAIGAAVLGIKAYRGAGDETPIKVIGVAAVVFAVVAPLTLIAGIVADSFPGLPLFWELGLFASVVWLATLVDAATREPSEGNDKVAWVIIVTFVHVVGAALYLLVRRPRRLAERQAEPADSA